MQNRLKCTADDIQNVFEYIAAVNSLDAAGRNLKNRFALIPDGQQTIEELTNKGCDLLTELLKTLPEPKMHTVKKLAPSAKFRVYFAPRASVDPDMVYVTDKDLTALCRAAHEQCKLCFNQNCSSCEYGKMFDRLISIDRDGGSWAQFDI